MRDFVAAVAVDITFATVMCPCGCGWFNCDPQHVEQFIDGIRNHVMGDGPYPTMEHGREAFLYFLDQQIRKAMEMIEGKHADYMQ